MNNFNPCSSCRFRHDNSNLNQIYQCCYNACSRFGDGVVSDVCRTKCRNCAGGGILYQKPSLISKEGYFWDCLPSYKNDKNQSLNCCLQKCGEDYECQEHCIDDFNSTIPVVEKRVNYLFIILFPMLFLLLFKLLRKDN